MNYLNVSCYWWNILRCGWDVYVFEMMVILVIHVWELSLCGDELAGNIFVVENGMLRRVSFMPKLFLTKATWGSRLMGYLSKYHPNVLTLNDMSGWLELLHKRFSWLFLCIKNGLLLSLVYSVWREMYYCCR